MMLNLTSSDDDQAEAAETQGPQKKTFQRGTFSAAGGIDWLKNTSGDPGGFCADFHTCGGAKVRLSDLTSTPNERRRVRCNRDENAQVVTAAAG